MMSLSLALKRKFFAFCLHLGENKRFFFVVKRNRLLQVYYERLLFLRRGSTMPGQARRSPGSVQLRAGRGAVVAPAAGGARGGLAQVSTPDNPGTDVPPAGGYET